MSITIGRIGDKFGSNSTYKQPNTFPVYDEQQVLERTRPSLTSFISGDIYLKGGNGNHCIYKGGYYALHILRILDADKDLYHYRLERELGFDVLQANTVVIGDLTTSTDQKLLEENIHKTIGILDNPTHITTINFKEIKTDDKTPFDDLTIIESTNSLLQKVVSQQAFEAFLNLRNEINTDWAKLNKEFYGGIRNPAVFIIGKLDEKPLEVVGGKEKIRKEVNKFAREIREKKKELSLSKVTTPENSRVVGKYCITGKNDPIGQAQEPYIIKEVDLSGLSDIVALVPGTLEPVEPLTPLNVTVPEKGGLFFDPNGKEYSEGFKGKIAKIPYNPFKEAATHGFPNPSYAYYGSKQGTHSHGLGTKDCQNVDGEFEGTKGKARLWGSDNLNGIFKQGTSSLLHSVKVGSSASAYGGTAIPEDIDEKRYNEVVLNKWSHVPFSLPSIGFKKEDGSDPFYQVKDERVHFGFLIFQLYKDFNNWDLFEYRGITGLKRIPYIAGISKSFFRYYSASSREHWANINDAYYKTNKLAKIQPKGSDSFVRAYLDNYWVGWLATLPQTESKGYATNYYQDEYGIYYYRGYYSYTYQQIRSDIRSVSGNSLEPSPLASPEVYKAFRQKKWKNLSTHLLKGLIDLPEDLTIEAGDYFFSDVDYVLKKYDSLVFPNTEGQEGKNAYYKGDGNATEQQAGKEAAAISAINEDYVVDINKSQTLKSGTFMCTTKDGKLDVRTLYHFDSSLYLSEDANQAVKAVESEKYRNTNFYLLKKGPSFEQGKDLTIIAKSQILKEAYKNLKHPVSDSVQAGSDPLAGWLGYDDQDLKTKQLLFDLKGTDGYCLFHKGKLHLIAKDLTPLGTPDQASQRLDHEENKGYKSVVNASKPPTLIEKVNQKVQLRFHTASYDLNGKTNFNDSDSLSLSFKPADANSKQYGQEFYFLYLNTKHDVIGWETVSVSKLEHTKTVQLAEGIELERLNLSLLNSHRLYQANQGRFQLAQKRVDENIRRAQRNLEIQKMQADLNFATGILSSAAANTMAMGDSISNIAEFAKGGHGSDRWIDAFQDSYGGSGGTGHEFEYPINIGNKGRNGPQWKAMGRMGLSGVSRGAGLARTIGNYAIKTGHLFPERQRRINEDKKLAAEKLALMSLQMNTKHMTAQLNAQLEMNRIFSRYDVPAINTRDLNVEFRGNTQIHGKPLKEVHLVVYTPSAEQMKYLEEYVEEFGIGCDIPDAKISLFPGMAGCVLRYRNLEDKGMKNLINVTVREYLKTRLHTGVKVVEIAKADPHHACLNDAQYRAALQDKENKHTEAINNLRTEYDEKLKGKDQTITKLTNERNSANSGYQKLRTFETNVREALGPEYKDTKKTKAELIPGVITDLKTKLSTTEGELKAAKKAKTDADEEGKKKLEEAEKEQLTCDQFKKLAGHVHYDLTNQETIKNIEKLAVVLAVTVKYALLFNVDQRFGQDHLFQDVFKDLYEIAENDLVSGFLEAFQAEDWQKATIGAGTGSEWSKPIPTIVNHAKSEAAREKMVLQYTSETNNGRLFLDTDKDILNASKIVEGDFDYLSGAINVSPSTGKPVTYADIKQKAILNITVANLNQLKELLDDFCVSLENATMGHLINVNTFDTSGRSEKCLGVLPNTHCDEVNFIRLCYSGLRFYKRIWPVVDNTDVPYGFVTSGITREADKCQGKVSFGVVKHIKSSTIFPSIGLYAYNAKWPTWAVNGRTIRHGTLNHWLQVFEPYESSKSYDDIKPVIDSTAGIRVYKKGYTKTVKDVSHAGLDWCYVMDKRPGREAGPIKDCYLTVRNLVLGPYYSAREKFFNRAVQMISAVFRDYVPQAVDIKTTRIRVFQRQGKQVVGVDPTTLVSKANIDEIFGYETYKYALIHLLTMNLFRIRFSTIGVSYSDELSVISLVGEGFTLSGAQAFESWDNNRFTKYIQDQLNQTNVYTVSPDFAEAKDLFRGIHRNLRQWKDPTKDSNLALLAEELNRAAK